jgi:hypothetical protein
MTKAVDGSPRTAAGGWPASPAPGAMSDAHEHQRGGIVRQALPQRAGVRGVIKAPMLDKTRGCRRYWKRAA